MFTFAPAVREQVGLLIALAGPSGCGKTMSALRLAQGISPDGKIAFVDTEARRGLHYADRFKFLHADMRAPFSPTRFVDAVKAAEASGAEVVIIDSFSHEYDGEGGLIDIADQEARNGRKSPSNWIKPKQDHKRLMNALLQCRASIIFCLRADEKIEIVDNPDRPGRQMVRPLGWVPICEKRFMYEMTASFTLTADQPGIPRYDLPHKVQEQHRGFFPPDHVLSEESGMMIAEWARGGAPKTLDAAIDDARDMLRSAAIGGTEPLKIAWNELSTEIKRALKSDLDALKAAAAEADKNGGGE